MDALRARLRELLVPRDPADGHDVVVEVRSGEGGEESALFAGDLLRMYSRFAERRGWKVEVLSAAESDLGGYKDVTVIVTAPGSEPEGVWAWLKYEGGVHRVQRVPVTESQGRIHTSAAGVLVLPRGGCRRASRSTRRTCASTSSGPRARAGRASTPPTPPCASPTCPPASSSPARTSARSCRTGPAPWRCCARGCRRWPTRRRPTEASADRRSQVRTVDRSERVRTYNYPENRISDHRIGYKSYDLDRVLDGDLDAVLDALRAADREERLAEAAQEAGQGGSR